MLLIFSVLNADAVGGAYLGEGSGRSSQVHFRFMGTGQVSAELILSVEFPYDPYSPDHRKAFV